MGHLLQLHQTHLRLTLLLLYQVGFHYHHHICPKSTLERCWEATYIEEEHISRDFLAVQDSSIGDIVSQSLSESDF